MHRQKLNLATVGVGLIAVLSYLASHAVHADEASRKHALEYVQPAGCEKPVFVHVRTSFDQDQRNLDRYKAYQSCLSTFGKALTSDFMSLATELKTGGPQDQVNAISEKMKAIVASLRDLKALSAEATTKLQWMHNASSEEQMRNRGQ